MGMMGAGIPRDWAFSWKDVEVAMMTSMIKYSAFGFFEGGPFLTEFTMSNQNKRENIFSALSIDAEKKPILKERQY